MDRNRELGIGLVGAGLFGALRARALRGHPGCRLVAVADVERSRAERIAGGAAVFTDIHDLLAAPGVDAVVVSTPIHLHEEIAIAAFAARKHVLCEKPLAPTAESCRRILDSARTADRVLAVGFNHRYFASVRFLKRSIDEGRIGTLDHLRLFAGHDGLANFREEWMYRSESSGGGAMMDLGIHLTDLARVLAGEIAEVSGLSTNRVWKIEGSEDDALALFRSVSGVPVSYQATWSEWRGYRFSVEAYGDRGMIRASYGPMWNLLIERNGGRVRRTCRLYPWINLREKLFGWQTTAWRTLRDELADFRERIDGRAVPLADGVAGLRAVEIAAAVRESGARGVSVRLDTPPTPRG